MTALAIVIFVLGIMALRRAHRWHHGYYGDGWHGRFGHGCHAHRWGGWHGRHVKHRMMLHWLFSRIDASPAQERAIIAELEKLQDRLRATKAGVHEARGDLAAALRGPMLDDAALGAVLPGRYRDRGRAVGGGRRAARRAWRARRPPARSARRPAGSRRRLVARVWPLPLTA